MNTDSCIYNFIGYVYNLFLPFFLTNRVKPRVPSWLVKL